MAADALQALKPRGAEAAGVEAQEGRTTMLLPRLYAGLQKGLEDTGELSGVALVLCGDGGGYIYDMPCFGRIYLFIYMVD